MMGTTKLSQFESQFSRYLKVIYTGTVDYPTLYQNYQRFYSGVPANELCLKVVLDEKRREFVEEGLRWFDICRHKLNVTHTDIAGVTRTLQPDDSRKVIQIPESVIIYGDLQPGERKNISESETHLVIRN